MKESNGVVDFSDLFKLIGIDEFLVKLELALVLVMRGGLHQVFLEETPMRVGVLHVRVLATCVVVMAHTDTPGVRALPAHPLLLPQVLRGSAAYTGHVVDHLKLVGIHVFHVHLLVRDYFWLQVLFLLVIATVPEIIVIVTVVVIGDRLFLRT